MCCELFLSLLVFVCNFFMCVREISSLPGGKLTMADLKAYSADWLPGLDVHLARWRTLFIVLCSDNLCVHLFILYHLCARLFVL